MTLPRKSTILKFKQLNDIIKKEIGGDIGSKTQEKSLSNLIYVKNPFDNIDEISTIEDVMNIPENVVKFNDFNHLDEKKEIKQENISSNDIQKNVKGINNWHSDFKYNVPIRQNLIAGKPIQIGEVNGFIKRINGDKIIIESGMEELEFPINNIFKNYKVDKENKNEFDISFKNPNQDVIKFENFK